MNRKIKVLIVDDEVLVRIGVVHAIAWDENGFEIVGEASDGEGCLQMTKKYKPDLIVLDINMPGMNGIETMRQLKKLGYAGKVIMLTCYDEFEYVREAMREGASDYVLKTNLNGSIILDAIQRLNYDNTQKAEKSVAEPEKQEILIESYLRHQIEGWSFGTDVQTAFRTSSFYVLVGKICGMKKIERRYAQKGLALFYRSLHSILEQALAMHKEHNLIQYNKETIGIFISFSDTVSMQEIYLKVRRIAQHIYSLMMNYLDFEMRIGVSGFHCGEANIRQAWEQAVMMVDNVYFEKKMVLYFDDICDKYDQKEIILEKITEKEKEIKELIFDGLLEKLKEEMQAYFEQIRLGKIVSSLRVKMFCTDIVKLVQAKERNNCEENVLINIQQEESLEDLECCFYTWLERILPENLDQNANWQVRKACDYIRDHYEEDVNLSRIAELLNLSESYTSRIFNKQMGMNIPGYVNWVRIEKAKELLKTTNQKIYEIAQEVGYASTTAFHIAFKKNEGITPIEYRNM